MKTLYSTQKDAHSLDWHPAEIESEVKKRFGSYAGLARAWSAAHPDKTVGRHTLVKAARERRSALGESIISWGIDVPAADIWPSRYDAQGKRILLQPGRKPKSSPIEKKQSRKAAIFEAVLGLNPNQGEAR